MDFFVNALTLDYFTSDNSRYGTEWNGVRLHDNYHRLYYIAEGGARVVYNGITQILREGSSYLFPITQSFSYECPDHMYMLNICFKISIDPNVDLLDIQPYKVEVPRSDRTRFLTDMSRITNLIHARSFSEMMELRGLTMTLLEAHFQTPMTPAFSKRRTQVERMAPALEYVHNNIKTRIEISQLCDTVNMSRSHFAKVFKATFHMSAQDYVRKQKVEQAKIALWKTTQSISSIAEELGFSNAAHFTTEFKWHTGHSPRDFRSMNLFFA